MVGFEDGSNRFFVGGRTLHYTVTPEHLSDSLSCKANTPDASGGVDGSDAAYAKRISADLRADLEKHPLSHKADTPEASGDADGSDAAYAKRIGADLRADLEKHLARKLTEEDMRIIFAARLEINGKRVGNGRYRWRDSSLTMADGTPVRGNDSLGVGEREVVIVLVGEYTLRHKIDEAIGRANLGHTYYEFIRSRITQPAPVPTESKAP